MNLAIVNLTGGGISGGYKKYLLRMMPFFERDARITRVLCAAPAGVPVADWFEGFPKTKFITCLPFSPLRPRRDYALRAELDAFKPDLVFVPLERPFDYPGAPVVAVLQNMAPLGGDYSPGLLSEHLRHAVQRHCARRAMLGADHVIAPSRFVKEFLTGKWGLPEEKVSVIYYGADGLGQEAEPPGASGWGKFLLTVGSIEKYRGLEDLFLALGDGRLAGKKLVVCGGARPVMEYYLRELKELAGSSGIGGRIVWINNLELPQLAWCYRNAEAFIVTSRVESAGPNTVLEALSLGAPVIAADNPPMPEFMGDAGFYYKPGDGKMLADRIVEAMSLPEEKRARLAQTALERARRFDWGVAAEKTVSLFARIAARR